MKKITFLLSILLVCTACKKDECESMTHAPCYQVAVDLVAEGGTATFMVDGADQSVIESGVLQDRLTIYLVLRDTAEHDTAFFTPAATNYTVAGQQGSGDLCICTDRARRSVALTYVGAYDAELKIKQ